MMLPERVTILKSNGKQIDNVSAEIQPPDRLFIEDERIPLEEEDVIVRKLPNGLEERYVVVDRGFFMHAGYQAIVRREGTLGKGGAPSIIYNLHGPNARINIESTDSSVNVVASTPKDLFERLRSEITSAIEDNDIVERLVSHVDQMESAAGTGAFSKKYAEFMTVAADHMTVLSPFMHALSQLLITSMHAG